MQKVAPRLIVVLGLPGTGKTTLARAIANATGATHLFTDKIRDALGMRGRYDPESKEAIYNELFRLARAKLLEGGDVITDGTFYRAALREKLNELARECKAIPKWIEVCADPSIIRERVSKKREFSEADFTVYEQVSAQFEPLVTDHLVLRTDLLGSDELVVKAIEYLKA